MMPPSNHRHVRRRWWPHSRPVTISHVIRYFTVPYHEHTVQYHATTYRRWWPNLQTKPPYHAVPSSDGSGVPRHAVGGSLVPDQNYTIPSCHAMMHMPRSYRKKSYHDGQQIVASFPAETIPFHAIPYYTIPYHATIIHETSCMTCRRWWPRSRPKPPPRPPPAGCGSSGSGSWTPRPPRRRCRGR